MFEQLRKAQSIALVPFQLNELFSICVEEEEEGDEEVDSEHAWRRTRKFIQNMHAGIVIVGLT